MSTISLDNLEMQEEEKETTIALIKGVLAGFVNHGYKIGGFKAYITSDVLIGAGLSSSAAYASILEEMKKVATFFGKEVLLGLSIDDILDNISKLRELAGEYGGTWY